MLKESSAKWPRAVEVFHWAVRRNVRISELHRALFPHGEISYTSFDNTLNGYRRNPAVLEAVEERLADEVAADLGVSPAEARARLFPEA